MLMLQKLFTVNERVSPGLRQVVDNTAWLFSDRILRMGVSLLVGVWVARYLGPKQFGLYNYASAFVSLFGPLAQIGLDGIVVRDLTKDLSGKNEILGTAFALKLIGGVLTLPLSVGIISLLNPNDGLTRWLVGITAAGAIFQAFDTIAFWFQAEVESKYTVYAKNVAYLFVNLAKIVLIQTKAPLIAFACAGLAEIVLGAVGLVVVYRAKGQYFNQWRGSFLRAKQLLKESWLLTLSGLTIYVYSKIDQIMLGSLVDKSELAFYSVAVKLSEVFDFLPVLLAVSFLPKLTALKAESNNEYTKKFQLYFDVMFMLWLLVALPVSLGSFYIVNLLYGKTYATSATILSIYVWSQFGSNFGVARGTFLLIEGKVKISLYLSVIGALINIGLNLYLIPKFGAIGATVATLITYFVVTILLNFLIGELKVVGSFIIRSFNLPHTVLRIAELVR